MRQVWVRLAVAGVCAAAAVARPYDASDHALAGHGARIDDADRELSAALTEDLLRAAAADIPAEWLADEPGFDRPDQVREAYVSQLAGRGDRADCRSADRP